jgi:dTDP-3,4-didehydro-2,6-dideoxy-alpha-D-glucose 3-reductase
VLAEAASQWRCQGWEDAAEMLEAPAVDAIFLATPIGLHAAQGALALHAGKHLWCEKPLTGTATQTSALADLSRSRGLSLAEGFMYLYHPHFRDLAEMVTGGDLGVVRSVTCRFGIPPLERPGFRDRPELGGGAFLDVGCYPVSAISELFPDASANVLFAELVAGAGSAVDSEGRALLRLGEEVAVGLEWRIGSAYRNEIDCWGTEGSVCTERIFSKSADYVPRYRLLDRQGQESFRSGTPQNHFVAMLAAFAGMVADPAAAEAERRAVVRRAQLMELIRERSHRPTERM